MFRKGPIWIETQFFEILTLLKSITYVSASSVALVSFYILDAIQNFFKDQAFIMSQLHLISGFFKLFALLFDTIITLTGVFIWLGYVSSPFFSDPETIAGALEFMSLAKYVIFHSYFGMGINWFFWDFYFILPIILIFVAFILLIPWYPIFYIGTIVRNIIHRFGIRWKTILIICQQVGSKIMILLRRFPLKRGIALLFFIAIFAAVSLVYLVYFSIPVFIYIKGTLELLIPQLRQSIANFLGDYYSLVLIIISLLLIPSGVQLIKSYRILKFLSRISVADRKEIARQFGQFQTVWGRLLYVQTLRHYAITAQGTWPEGKVPNIDNDEGSTLLAQLEEKWLGLDR